MLSNTVTKLGGVFLFALPAVIVGGQLYSLVSGGTLAEGFLKIYETLYIIPGAQTSSLPECTITDQRRSRGQPHPCGCALAAHGSSVIAEPVEPAHLHAFCLVLPCCLPCSASVSHCWWLAGVNIAGEQNPLSWLLLNSIFLLGTFTFAVVLGVVSDDITQEVKRWAPTR